MRHNSDKRHSYYPVFLNIRGRRCLVIGGGQVALRKVKKLLEYGAKVEVISPDLCPELDKLAQGGEIGVFRRGYRTGDLRGAIIAIAATDDGDINQQVVKEARQGGILANVVDDARNSDFIAPSYLQRGDITIAISTAGASPALARKIRTRLERDFGDEYALLCLVMEEIRAELKQRQIEVCGDDWQRALDLDLMLDLLKKGEREKAKSILIRNLTGKQNS